MPHNSAGFRPGNHGPGKGTINRKKRKYTAPLAMSPKKEKSPFVLKNKNMEKRDCLQPPGGPFGGAPGRGRWVETMKTKNQPKNPCLRVVRGGNNGGSSRGRQRVNDCGTVLQKARPPCRRGDYELGKKQGRQRAGKETKKKRGAGGRKKLQNCDKSERRETMGGGEPRAWRKFGAMWAKKRQRLKKKGGSGPPRDYRGVVCGVLV